MSSVGSMLKCSLDVKVSQPTVYFCVQDDFPLASLPLLGYTVSSPGESDSIHKEYVFKLQFKSHVYFFRAESEYTFERYSDCFIHYLTPSNNASL